MTRKQWLQAFIYLADSGAAAIEYRKRLRLKTNVLGNHINQLTAYRKEFAELVEQEKLDERARQRAEQETFSKKARKPKPSSKDTGAADDKKTGRENSRL